MTATRRMFPLSNERPPHSNRRRRVSSSRRRRAGAIPLVLVALAAGCAAETGAAPQVSTTTVASAGGGAPSPGAAGAPDVAVAPGAPSARVARERSAIAIDVRTPAEHGQRHVQGAQLIDIQGGDFDTKVGALDRTRLYVVYCRSGNRSAAAAQRMRAAGLRVLDGGALDDMLAEGWPAGAS